MTAPPEIHLGLIVDAGDVLLVERHPVPEYKGMDELARHLPGGSQTEDDYGPASAVQRNILAQTGFYTNIQTQPLLNWEQKATRARAAARYVLWTGHLIDHPRMHATDSTIKSSGLVELPEFTSYPLSQLHVRFLRDILRHCDLLAYEHA